MSPNLSEIETDDLIYFARAGEDAELAEMLQELAARESSSSSTETTPMDILIATIEEESKATCLHMAAANGHGKTTTLILSYLPLLTKSSHKTSTTSSADSQSLQTETTEETTTTTTTTGAEPTSPSPSSSSSSSSAQAKAKAYIDHANTFGNTALHWACLGGHLSVAKLLLSRGASPAVANDKDQIPLDLAAFNNHMHVVEYFLSQSREIEGGNAVVGGGGGEGGGVEEGGEDGEVEVEGEEVVDVKGAKGE